MVRILENDCLAVSVDEKGAELSSVIDKKTKKELLWGANPEIWNRHAPLLFPYCGGLYNNEMIVDGEKYDAPKHGFARDMNFECTLADAQTLVFELRDNDETRCLYPFAFVLQVEYRLNGNTMTQKVTVTNPETKESKVLPFSVGFHPGFVIPFGESIKTEDYEIYFDKLESPTEIKTPNGYVNGEESTYFEQQQIIPLYDELFATDSICLSGLQSKYISVRESKRTTNYIRVKTEGFPYVLLWSAASEKMAFVCIEPWNNLPDGPEECKDFRDKPGNTLLATGESFATTLEVEFHVD